MDQTPFFFKLKPIYSVGDINCGKIQRENILQNLIF